MGCGSPVSNRRRVDPPTQVNSLSPSLSLSRFLSLSLDFSRSLPIALPRSLSLSLSLSLSFSFSLSLSLSQVDPSGSTQHGPTLGRVDPRQVDLEGSRRSTRGWATRSTQVGSTQGVGQRPRCVDPGGWPTKKLTMFVNVAWVSLQPRKGSGRPRMGRRTRGSPQRVTPCGWVVSRPTIQGGSAPVRVDLGWGVTENLTPQGRPKM